MYPFMPSGYLKHHFFQLKDSEIIKYKNNHTKFT